ncbi:SUN domain-containing protein 1 isoform X2 [Fundulus heteroclitus]|uniref:SUN domain-containing protein 1 isoform X2 n=1 Tax=Fundulus heteroclitus TaxID=8078 RepID=UPI00165A27FC|nr:SUN domain-containing protein 1 isoform X2 [Fundulus heteroclitus]
MCLCAALVMGEEDEGLQSWGWTDISSYSSSPSDSEQEQRPPSSTRTGLMSRRSLRLDEGLLDRCLPRSSASLGVGGAGWRTSRPRHSQRHSASCSESLLASSPRKAVDQLLHNSSLHSVASDATLISSLLDESSIQESTLVETFWGLDHDADPKESTVLTHESSTLIGSDSHCAKHTVQIPNRVCCKDCSCPSAPEADTESSTVYCRERRRRVRTAPSGDCGVMALKESNPKEPQPVGSLCDDCKEKQRSQLDLSSSSSSSSSWSSCLLGFMCSAAVFTAAALWLLTQTVYSASLRGGRSAGDSAGGVFRWMGRRWSRMSSGSHPSRLFIVLLPLLLLLFSLFWFRPASLHLLFPGFNATDVPGLSSVQSVLSSQSQSAEDAEEFVQSRPPSAQAPPQEVPPAARPPAAPLDSERLVQMEQSLRALWEEMAAAGRRAEQSHGELLQLYTDLRQQASGSDAELRVSGLLEQQLSLLRRRLNEERRQREQMRQQDLLALKTQMSRLDQLELQLQQVAASSRELHWTSEADTAPPAALPDTASAGVDKHSQDALQTDVSRLEAALVDVRRDVAGLSGCQDSCQQLDSIQQMISEQLSVLIREEVRALVYGNQLTQETDYALPESLLHWLSQQFVSEADLQEALSSLEFSILQNIGRRLKQQQQHGEEGVREAHLDTDGNGVTKEEVHVMVKEALRLFSHDRTGQADYALESGGGSIISTRCSETYETKAALLSLFGVPLWYFSQSPRAVIQPDVHPGNCWAFRGSTGFLVIQLSMMILPTAVTMEHIPKTLAPGRTLHSAPRDFSVYGLRDEHEESGKLLGNYTYDEDGEDLQTFPISDENNEAFQIIEVQVLSNWGHPEYTCMYRFRVHGTPSDV